MLVNFKVLPLGRALLPPSCIVCGNAVRSKLSELYIDICAGCVGDLPINAHACAVCAEPLPSSSPASAICGQCQQRRPKYHAAFCAYRYTYPIDHLVRTFKFHGRLAYGRVLGELLAGALLERHDEPWPQFIIPVPLADARFRERGFNQAIELGRVVQQRLDIPLRLDLVVRKRATREQTGLDHKQRRRNVRGAFSLTSKPRAKHVAILDDVVTTGSTVNELARVLKRARVERIEVWAVARTGR